MTVRMQIPDQILKLYSKCKKKNGDFNSRKFKSILQSDQAIAKWFEEASVLFCIEVTPLLVYYSSIRENKADYSPVCCLTCGKVLTEKQIKYHQYCSLSCAAKSQEIREKTQQTMLERYGAKHALQSKVIKEKFTKTCQEKFGGNSSFASESVRQKAKQSLLEHYGVTNPTQSQVIKEKSKKTCLEKYGVENPNQSLEVRQKTKQTCLERYGTENPLSSKEVRTKSKETWLKNFGVDNPWKSSQIKEKIIQSNLNKFGTKNPAQSELIKKKAEQTRRKNYYDHYLKVLAAKGITLLSSKEDYVQSKPLKFRCLQGHEWINENNAYGDCYQHIHCPECQKQQFSSNSEKLLLEYIKTLYSGPIEENTRKVLNKKELDIYLPEKKLAFEFDGTVYHSDQYRSKDYHQKKTLGCRDLGIRLIHIFEYEWMYKQEKIKALIRSSLGFFEKRIYARQCQVKSISSSQYEEFLDLYHLQGSVKSSQRLGLFYQDKLVAVIGFGQSRFKKSEIELHRYCVKSDYQIIGGFSKLIKHSNQHHFISYIDLSHYSGQGYESIGFKQLSITQPSYVYVKGKTILNRMQCQKHKLAKFLKDFNPNLSESENMAINGFYKIYDSGNLKVEYIK